MLSYQQISSEISRLLAQAYPCLLYTSFDFVFNTIPSFIFTRNVLSKHHKDTLFIELASTPGGFDKEAVSKLGLKLIDVYKRQMLHSWLV